MWRLSLLQLGVLLFLALLFLVGQGARAAGTVLLGGGTYWLPSVLSAAALEGVHKRKIKISSAPIFLETNKVVLIIVLMMLAYIFLPINLGEYLLGLFGVSQAGWLMLRKRIDE